ncbi:MAG: glycoside hydrolase [Caldithrix sp.]|nr:glycoside hydrolase [Caldithrix sp.]
MHYRQMIQTILLICLFVSIIHSKEWSRIVNLQGLWRFTIGDNERWAEPAFNDNGWDQIEVPSNWENQGYPGYDGFAWYRTGFLLSSNDVASNNNYIRLGFIDDADEVYVNGHFIGFKGAFPPHTQTAYHEQRLYFCPADFLRSDTVNIIAVRVYDNYKEGGIIRGQTGIYKRKHLPPLDVSLAGYWKFQTGDSIQWKNPTYQDTHWQKIYVPLWWETQGFYHYDGIAWYRKRITIPDNLTGQELILLLGRIDDLDEIFLNGQRIGGTAHIQKRFDDNYLGEYYQQLRAYYLPSHLLNRYGENTIAVRVFDGFINGGIYDIPVGITQKNKYEQWQKDHPQSPPDDNFLNELLRSIFN